MTTAEKYVTAAYCAVFAVVLVYVVLIALKLHRLEREVDELERRRRRSRRPRTSARRSTLAELLFWPALLLLRRSRRRLLRRRAPSRHGRSGGDVGRAARLARADGAARRAGRSRRRLPVGDVGGVAQPFRLARRRGVSHLGLPAAVPAARPRRHAARRGAARRRARGGGTGVGARSHYSNLFLVLHVGLVLAAFAGFTLAAALSALYLWQERRLKTRAATILRRPAPSLATLDRLAVRTVVVSVPALTLGIAVGIGRLVARGERVDAVVVATLATWVVWAAYLVVRARGWSGRRASYVALAGFALVIVVRLALPATHFA